MEILKVEKLSKKIKKKQIIVNSSFDIKKGEIYGFIGPNGAGKTTMMRLLTGLISPTTGKITIDGFDVNKDRKNALSNGGAIVESPIFFEYLSGEKVLYNLALLIEGISKLERRERVEEALKIVGLYNRRKDKVKTYSLGMKQRLGIAQALLNKPKIIFLDEPANGLDPMGMIELRELILKLNKEGNITFIISSHLLDELQKICNNLIIIRDGNIIWNGKTKEFINQANGKSLEEVFVNLMMGESYESINY